jgi:protease-4
MNVIKKIGTLFLTLGLSGCITISLFPRIEPLQETVLEGSGDKKILLLDISGVISEESGDGVVEEPDMVARIKETLLKAEQDHQIKAVVLRINSPGGTVTASDMIYHEIIQFKERTGIKVIASISGIGASGAYYIAMAADQIIANPTAITGSIGVIMLHMNVNGLLEKIGVGAEAIKSGAHKDMGSPFKELSVEDRKIFQGMIDGMQEQFLEIVTKGRKEIGPEQLKVISSGRIFSTQEAKKLKLIDQIGHLDHAIAFAMREAGVENAKIISYGRPYQYMNNIYSRTLSGMDPLSAWKVSPKDLLNGRAVNFFYLWMP